MRRSSFGRPLAFVWAVLATAALTALLHGLRAWVNTSIVALAYLLPVGFSTTRWGLGPGISAALSAFFALNFFFVPPYFTLAVLHPENLLALLSFLVVAITLSQLLGRERAMSAAAQAREQDAVFLSELAAALIGLTDPLAIARVVADKICLTLPADWTVIQLQLEDAKPPISIRAPPGRSPAPGRPSVILPIHGMRRLLGEISVWYSGNPLTREQGRLLHTLATQAALALERASLSQAEARASLLEQTDSLKSAMLSSVSHELRTPLATIKASISGLRTGAVPWESDDGQDLLLAIEEETDHLNHLVGNLLDMSRIEAGSLQPQRSWNLINEVVSSALQRSKSLTRHHAIILELAEDLPLVPLDFLQVEQVLANLLSNSVKYSPPGTAIRIRALLQDDRNLCVEVVNQSPPIPANELERVFDKFFRLPGDPTVSGTGLGLSICKGIILAHGGRIWAENRQEGVAFCFTLPLSLEAASTGRGPA